MKTLVIALCMLASGCSIVAMPFGEPTWTLASGEEPKCSTGSKLVAPIVDTLISGAFVWFYFANVASYDGDVTTGSRFARKQAVVFGSSAALGYARAWLCSREHSKWRRSQRREQRQPEARDAQGPPGGLDAPDDEPPEAPPWKGQGN